MPGFEAERAGGQAPGLENKIEVLGGNFFLRVELLAGVAKLGGGQDVLLGGHVLNSIDS